MIHMNLRILAKKLIRNMNLTNQMTLNYNKNKL